jgi:hypothetical protein
VKRFGVRCSALGERRVASAGLSALVAIAGLLTACGSEAPWSLERTENAFGGRSVPAGKAVPLLAVAPVGKEGDPSCGDVATLAVLRYWKGDSAAQPSVYAKRVTGSPIAAGTTYAKLPDDALTVVLAAPGQGATPPSAIRDYVNHESGLAAVYFFDTHVGPAADQGALLTLEAAIDRGEPTIVSLTEAPGLPYYVVVTGYDAADVYAMDPHAAGTAAIPIADFLAKWHGAIGPDGRAAAFDVVHAAVMIHADAGAAQPK